MVFRMIHLKNSGSYQEAKFGRLGIFWTFICQHSEVLGGFLAPTVNKSINSLAQGYGPEAKTKGKRLGGVVLVGGCFSWLELDGFE